MPQTLLTVLLFLTECVLTVFNLLQVISNMMVIYNICGTYFVFLHVSLVCFHCHSKRYHTFKINTKIKPVIQQCLFQKSIEFRQNTEFNGSPYFYFYPSHLFSLVLHTVCKENSFSLRVQLMNGQPKNRSPWWKRDAHIHQLSHYITAYRTESRKWITGFKKEETGLINTPTFMQSKIRALPQHAIETAIKCFKICRHK